MIELDSFDIRLLAVLQQNNQLTSAQLAERVGLSPAACLRRAKRLREEGIIIGDVSLVAPEAVGRRMTMIVLVEFERERIDLIDTFKSSMQRTLEVMQCWYVTGDADFVLLITAEDMADYEAFTNRFFFENPNIRRFRTMVVMNRVKFGMAVPIRAA